MEKVAIGGEGGDFSVGEKGFSEFLGG